MSSTNHTTNYALPQWVSSDPFRREDFNDAFSKIDDAIEGAGPKVAIGEYDGEATNLPYNGYQVQTVTLGFRPKFLLITTGTSFSSATSAILIGEMQITSSGHVLSQITDTGFTVGTAKYQNDITYPELNSLHQHYRYFAIG